MKRIYVLLFILNLAIAAYAQGTLENIQIGPKFKSMMNTFDSCTKNTPAECSYIIDTIIENGKQEKVDFLDYLYFRKAIYLVKQNDLNGAFEYAKLAIAHPNPIAKDRITVDAYNIVANYYYYIGALDSSLHYYLLIADIIEKEKDKPLKLGYLYSNIATLLGTTYNNKGQISYLHKSYAILDSLQDKTFIATVASNLALAYHAEKDTPNQIKWADISIARGTPLNDFTGLYQSYNIKSLMATDSIEAKKYAQLSLDAALQTQYNTNIVNAYNRMSGVYYNQQLYKEALEYAQKAMSYATDITDKHTYIKAAHAIAVSAYALKDYALSTQYFNEYAKFHEEVNNQETSERINELNTKYEAEKKERLLAEQALELERKNSLVRRWILGGISAILIAFMSIILYRRNQQKKMLALEQEKENAVLRAIMNGEERERNRISKDLHDGVAAMLGAAKMSLQSIPYLPMEKQSEQLDKVANLIGNTHADVRRIAHDLLPRTLEKEGLIPALLQFATDMNQMGMVQLQVDNKIPHKLILKERTELMLYRIIQELINNVFKHSKATLATITLEQFAPFLKISVEDNGIGYADDPQNQGLYSIKERLKVLGGSFDIKGQENKGTRAELLVRI